MEYKKLGQSGLSISPIVIGCMTYGSKDFLEWILDDEDEIFKIMKRAYDLGMRTFDTADCYSNGKSEEILGKFIKKFDIPRDKIVIMTKCFFPLNLARGKYAVEHDDFELANSQGLSRKHVFDAVEGSVKRLGTHIDVLQIHRLDNTTPKTEIMKALNDVIDQGYTRYIGASAMKAVEFAELQYTADKNGWHKFISMQSYYHLLYREDEKELNFFCQNTDIGKVGLVPYSPLARGLLAKPHKTKSSSGRSKETDAAMAKYELDNLRDSEVEIINRVEELAKKYKVPMSTISLGWLMKKGACPIVGVNSVERVEEIAKAPSFKMSEEDLKYLEEPYETRTAFA